MLLLGYISMHLKSKMQYKLSFLFITLSQLLSVLLEVFVLYSLFDKFKLLDEYKVPELMFCFSTIWVGYSVAEFIGRGFDHFADLIIRGDFDLLLIRPCNIYSQVIGSDIGIEKATRILLSVILYIYGFINIINEYTFSKIFLLITIPIGSTIIVMSLLIIAATFCFFSTQGIELVNIFTNGARQVGQYPMGIYNKIIKRVFTFIIPLTLINYYPVMYLLDKSDNILYVFMPLLASLFIIPAIVVFNFGMRKYKSTGS